VEKFLKNHRLLDNKCFLFSPLAGVLLCAAALIAPPVLSAQTAPPKPGTDTLLLVDGEKLIGHFVSADAKNVTFTSDLAGTVKIDWAKVQELKSSDKFAVAQKGQVFGRKSDPAQVPQGTVSVADQKLSVEGGTATPTVIPVANTQNVIPQGSFLRAFRRARITDYWKGAASFGAAIVQATQTSRTFTSSLAMVRTVPSEDWISPRYRTTFDLSTAYGTNTSAGVTVKTNIIHAGIEQDEYLNPRLFFILDGMIDHNYSQGLQIQQTYSGGFGLVAYKSAKSELDFKGQLAYINEEFTTGPGKELVGALLSQSYNRSLIHGASLHEELSVTPSFNVPTAYSANFLTNLGIPVTKKINLTAGFQDSFLNNPPAGFKKNSLLFTTAITYKIN
jgi:hypothetical protein